MKIHNVQKSISMYDICVYLEKIIRFIYLYILVRLFNATEISFALWVDSVPSRMTEKRYLE